MRFLISLFLGLFLSWSAGLFACCCFVCFLPCLFLLVSLFASFQGFALLCWLRHHARKDRGPSSVFCKSQSSARCRGQNRPQIRRAKANPATGEASETAEPRQAGGGRPVRASCSNLVGPKTGQAHSARSWSCPSRALVIGAEHAVCLLQAHCVLQPKDAHEFAAEELGLRVSQTGRRRVAWDG